MRAIQATPQLCPKDWLASSRARAVLASTGWPAFAGHDREQSGRCQRSWPRGNERKGRTRPLTGAV